MVTTNSTSDEGDTQPEAFLPVSGLPLRYCGDLGRLEWLSTPEVFQPMLSLPGHSAWLYRSLVASSFRRDRFTALRDRSEVRPTIDEMFLLTQDYWRARAASYLRDFPKKADRASSCTFWGYVYHPGRGPHRYCYRRYCPFCWARSGVRAFRSLARLFQSAPRGASVWAYMDLDLAGHTLETIDPWRLVRKLKPIPAGAVSVSIPVGRGPYSIYDVDRFDLRFVAVGSGPLVGRPARRIKSVRHLVRFCARWFRYPRTWDTPTVSLGWSRAEACPPGFKTFQVHGACRSDWRPGGWLDWGERGRG